MKYLSVTFETEEEVLEGRKVVVTILNPQKPLDKEIYSDRYQISNYGNSYLISDGFCISS